MLAAFKRAQNATKKGGSKKDPKAKKAPGRAKQAGGKASPRVKSTRSGGHTSNGGSTVPVATDAPVSHFEQIPPEVLLKVLSLLDGKTLMVSVPQVCHRWRAACAAIRNVHLDFSWWGGLWEDRIPVEVLAGWGQTPFMIRTQKETQRTERMLRRGGGVGNIAGNVWKTGMCELFPRTTSVTMWYGQIVEDAHLLALADKCRGLTHANFKCCGNMTDVAPLELAAKCIKFSRLTHATFTILEADGCSRAWIGRQVPSAAD